MKSNKVWQAYACIAFLFFYACNNANNSDKKREDAASNYNTETFQKSKITENLSGGSASKGAFVGYSDKNASTQTHDNKESDYTYTFKDTAKKYIRSCDIKFKVNNVRKATQQIEYLVDRMGGYLESSDMSSKVESERMENITEDSSVQTTQFTTSNQISLRVPVEHLDSTVRSLNPLILYLDFRHLKTEDMSLEILSKSLEQERLAKYGIKTHTIRQLSSFGDNVSDTKYSSASTVTENWASETEEQKNTTLISALKLKHDIRWSTVSIEIYQNPQSLSVMMNTGKVPDKFKPGFFKTLSNNIAYGWNVLIDFLLFLFKGWSLLLIVGLVLWWFITFISKQKQP